MSNHLKDQSSPYLLQHADNPVDWYPWGKEAFEKAEREDKPVFCICQSRQRRNYDTHAAFGRCYDFKAGNSRISAFAS